METRESHDLRARRDRHAERADEGRRHRRRRRQRAQPHGRRGAHRRRVRLRQHRRPGPDEQQGRRQGPDRQEAHARAGRRRAARDRPPGDRGEPRRGAARAPGRGPGVRHLRHGRRHRHGRLPHHRPGVARPRRPDDRHRDEAVPVRGAEADAPGRHGHRRDAQARRHDGRRPERAPARGRGEGHPVPGRPQEGRRGAAARHAGDLLAHLGDRHRERGLRRRAHRDAERRRRDHGYRHRARREGAGGVARGRAPGGGCAAVPRARGAADARAPARIRQDRGAARPPRDVPRASPACWLGGQRARDPHLHSETDGLMAWRGSHYVAAGLFAGGALLWAGADAWPWRRPLTAPPIVLSQAYVDFADTLGKRETLSAVLARGGIVGRDYAGLLAAARDLDVRRLRPGLVFQFRRLKTDTLAHQVTIRTGPETRLRLARGNGAWSQTVEVIPWTVARVRVSGLIETSLYDALDKAMPDSLLPAVERRLLAWEIADVYDWEVDFTRDVHPGDRFLVLMERLESGGGERRFGRILAARVNTGRTQNYAFYFEAGDRTAGFFDEQGRSLKRAFLRAPLQFRRVSSRFGGRYHPVLHRWRSHEGIDFAAAYGTPVRATADGLVTRVGREDDGYGNLIELRHANGIRTRYGHLSGFARGLRVGERVQQGETIGYVGSTGLSTGPHLHYEFLVNGRATNPQRKDMGAGTPVPSASRSAYDTARAGLLAQLEPPTSRARRVLPVVAAATPTGRD